MRGPQALFPEENNCRTEDRGHTRKSWCKPALKESNNFVCTELPLPVLVPQPLCELVARIFYWFQELSIIPGSTRTGGSRGRQAEGSIRFADTIKYVGFFAKMTHKTMLPPLLTRYPGQTADPSHSWDSYLHSDAGRIFSTKILLINGSMVTTKRKRSIFVRTNHHRFLAMCICVSLHLFLF